MNRREMVRRSTLMAAALAIGRIPSTSLLPARRHTFTALMDNAGTYSFERGVVRPASHQVIIGYITVDSDFQGEFTPGPAAS